MLTAKRLYGYVAILKFAPSGSELKFPVVGLFCSTCILTSVRRDVDLEAYTGDEIACESCGKVVTGNEAAKRRE